jgi:hypothetical protein
MVVLVTKWQLPCAARKQRPLLLLNTNLHFQYVLASCDICAAQCKYCLYLPNWLWGQLTGVTDGPSLQNWALLALQPGRFLLTDYVFSKLYSD